MLASDCIKFQGGLYAPTDEAKNAVCQLEWAYGVLGSPVVIYPNGKNSHEIAGAMIEEFEDVLLDHIRLTA